MTVDGVRRAEVFRELSRQDCLDRLNRSAAGRVALCTPDGPVILPVNYLLEDETVVIRTAPYTLLAGHAWEQTAFEIDDIDSEMRRGWSVLVRGQAAPVEDADEITALHLVDKLTPWAPGSRPMFIRITPREITGREVAY